MRKVYDVSTSNGAPDDFRIELRPGENRVAVTIHDDKPSSANGEAWAQFGLTAGITVATLLIRSVCLSGALNRAARPSRSAPSTLGRCRYGLHTCSRIASAVTSPRGMRFLPSSRMVN
ncbi:hypothetical protein [Micromonospora sp. NPDC049274]|uniref:hypothetical protein n=1 Tax=Micromonospora sp. NPDC049274 TaxID=3154829 RepID=UPI0034358AA6